jgi:MYXO-CTERM domain-containing protein
MKLFHAPTSAVRIPFHPVHAVAACAAVGALALWEGDASACTNFLVSKGASADNSTMITYVADSHTLYGELYFHPAGKFEPGAMLDIHQWGDSDSSVIETPPGKFLGQIPQARETYKVVGNMNEHQVSIGETTFGGRAALNDPKGGIDYGSLIYLALQRSKTAREAIGTMVSLANQFGYRGEDPEEGSGETFSIADPREVWMMDVVSKGPDQKGIVWVALRVPEGYVTAHANQSRIRKFPRNDPDNCMYAPDVVSFARSKGFFNGKDEDFSFADAYDPVECEATRGCEGRVWSFFHRIAPSLNIPSDLIECKPGAAPLPLWVKPDAKLTPQDLIRAMRDHFEGTKFDMTNDVGAGPFELPYRWRPLVWTVGDKQYMNERAVSTQQTGFSFVAQARSFLPDTLGGLVWFSVDDTNSTVYVPMYASISRVPKPYAVGNGSFTEFTWDSAFWVFNWVANQAYTRYKDEIVDIRQVQQELEGNFFSEQPKIEQEAAALYRRSPAAAEEYLTSYSEQSAANVLTRWKKLGEHLLVKYLDGNVRDGYGRVTHPRLPDSYYKRVVAETGDRFYVGPAPKKDGAHAAPSASAAAAPPASAAPAAPAPAAEGSHCSLSAGKPRPGPLGFLGLALVGLGALRRSTRRRS